MWKSVGGNLARIAEDRDLAAGRDHHDVVVDVEVRVVAILVLAGDVDLASVLELRRRLAHPIEAPRRGSAALALVAIPLVDLIRVDAVSHERRPQRVVMPRGILRAEPRGAPRLEDLGRNIRHRDRV